MAIGMSADTVMGNEMGKVLSHMPTVRVMMESTRTINSTGGARLPSLTVRDTLVNGGTTNTTVKVLCFR
jgi:hypothetical protein